MKKPFNFTKASMLLAACGALLQVNAYADGGIVEISGQISPTTCILSMNDRPGNLAGGDTKTLNFGDFTNLGVSSVGAPIGTSQKVYFALTSTSVPGTACLAVSPTSTWNVVLDLNDGAVATLSNNKTYLKNQDPTGTDAVILLKGGSAATGSTLNVLDLVENKGYMSTPISATNVSFGVNSGLVLEAQMAYATDNAPKAGAYIATVPLLVVYK